MDTSLIADTWGPRCQCGLYQIGAKCPYCETNRSAVAQARRAAPKEVKEVTRESLRQEANERLDRVKQETIRELEAQRASNSLATPAAQQPKHPKKKRAPRRSSVEMAAARAQKEKELADIAALVTPAWLADDSEMDAFMQQYRESEPI